MKAALSLLTALAVASCASVPAPEGQTSIPYVASNGIVEWKAPGPDALYIRAITGDWYLARTINACPRLAVATSLGFVTNNLGELDRYGAILAQGQRCPLASIVKSAPPPGETQG